jgi:hypothetical protein
LSASGGNCPDPHWKELGHLAKVLGGGGEEEFVSGSVWSPKAKPVELQDALEIREQHLDFFSLAPGGDIGVAFRQIPRQVTSTFVDRANDFAGRLAGDDIREIKLRRSAARCCKRDAI